MNKGRWSLLLVVVGALLGIGASSSSASAQCFPLQYQTGPDRIYHHIYTQWHADPQIEPVLGCPISDYIFIEKPRGAFVKFERGYLFGSANAVVNEVHGAILDFYLRGTAFGAGMFLHGYPITNELAGVNGSRYNLFENGGIWWHPTTGAISVYGDIFEDYYAAGADERYGHPVTPETDGDGYHCMRRDRQQFFGDHIVACWLRDTRQVSFSWWANR